MKHKSLAVLCAFALIMACPGRVYGTGGDEPLLPAGVEQTQPAEQAAPPAQTAQQEQTEQPPSEQTDGQPVPPTETEQPKIPQQGQTVFVGLAYGDNAVAGANLANDVGSGFLFGYLDAERQFQQVGYTERTSLSVVKTQNVYYGYNYGNNLVSYSDTITSDILVGCWHVQIPGTPATFEEARANADAWGGFPAWINGTWQVRLGAYGTQEEAQAAANSVGGAVVGTSAYGVSVVQTGTNIVLFQFDGGESTPLTVMPNCAGGERTVTHFRGTRYYGGFKYQRINGGNLTVVNVVNIDDYVSCVVSQEMSPSWPMEALKAQAVCARSYQQFHLNSGSQHKQSEGFEVCSTTHCQAYPGVKGTTERTDQAVAETAGLSVWYHGEPADTVYFASDGGGTEDVKNVWGSSNYPYLCGIIDPYEETISEKIAYWDNVQTFTASEITAIIQPYIQSKGYNCAAIVDFQVTELTPTGNVKSISFTDANGKSWPFTQSYAATIARTYLGIKSIRYTVTKSGEATGGVYYTDGGNTLSSMNGVYAINGDGKARKLTGNPYVITASGTQFLPAPTGGDTSEGDAVFTITSRGYGHNIGMSQWGAYAMAQQGFTFDEILKFYYPGIEIY